MSAPRLSFLGYLITFGGGVDIHPLPEKDHFPQKRTQKVQNKFVSHHIRELNKARLRQANNHAPCHRM